MLILLAPSARNYLGRILKRIENLVNLFNNKTGEKKKKEENERLLKTDSLESGEDNFVFC